MKKEEAINIVRQALSQFNGNLGQHQTIQEALVFLVKMLEVKAEPPKSKKAKDRKQNADN